MAARTSRDLRLDVDGVTGSRLEKSQRLTAAELRRLESRIGKILARIDAGRGTGAHRYRELPYARKNLAAVRALADELRPRTDNLVVLGIGGSALGNIALQTALRPPTYNYEPPERRGGPRLFVLDNVDPVQFDAVMNLVGSELDRTIINVISKSGETAETAAQFLIARQMLRDALGPTRARDQIVAITDPAQGTMRRIVDEEGYRSLPVPDGVGGRFSVLSPVGLFSAAMCGIDVGRLLKGAASMDKPCSAARLADNPAAMIAAVHFAYRKRGKTLSVMMPYSFQLKDMADWFRQLWAESLGKRYSADGRKELFTGLTPIKALGVTDQHSQVQLYREGPNDKVFTLLEVEKFATEVDIPNGFPRVAALSYLGNRRLSELFRAELDATRLALLASGRPCLTVAFPRVDEWTIGQFIYLYETATTITGMLLNIDPYDQPGVELGKQITFHLMGRKGYEKLPQS